MVIFHLDIKDNITLKILSAGGETLREKTYSGELLATEYILTEESKKFFLDTLAEWGIDKNDFVGYSVSPYRADTLILLGVVLWGMEKMKVSLECHEKALAMREETLGDHPDTVKCYHHIANVLSDDGNHSRAIECEQTALRMAEKIFGKDSPEIIESLSALGITYVLADFDYRAGECYERAVNIGEKHFGEGNADASDYYNLGAFYRYEKKDNVRAGVLYEKSAIAYERECQNKETIAEAYKLAGQSYVDEKVVDKAIECLEKSLVYTLEAYGEVHEKTAEAYLDLGIAYCEREEGKKDGLGLLYEAERIGEKTLKKDDFILKYIYSTLSVTLFDLGESELASEYLTKASAR